MAETLIDPTLHGHTPEATMQPAPEAEARGFRAGVREAGESAYSFLDLSAGISLTASDIRYHSERLDIANNRYNGILERQTATDTISVALEADLLLDYRRDVQRAGYTDVDAMPAELRQQVVENTVRSRADDIIAELESHHPEWSREQLAEAAALRISDIITVLSMDAAQRDAYRAELFDYRDTKDRITTLETDLETKRQERRERLGAIGRVAVRAMMSVVNVARTAPRAVATHAAVTGMTLRQKVGEWYQNRSPEGKKATMFTAAGVAIAGIATYIGMRYGGYESGSQGNNFVLASNATDIGAQAPDVSEHIGGHALPHMGAEAPDINGHIGGGPLPHIGAQAPELPPHIGGENIPHIGAEAPDLSQHIGGEMTGGDLRGVKTSSELFGKGTVAQWPESVKVSGWDSQTKDGSLWGISEEMLQRSGVHDPSDAQIDRLVDALRPQAGQNGQLHEGQTLDLRPAIDLLPELS